MSNKNYIGLACTMHDPALAVVNDQGKIVYAEATERYLQFKRAFNCPPDPQGFRSQEILRKYCSPGAEIVIAKTWSAAPSDDESSADNAFGQAGGLLPDLRQIHAAQFLGSMGEYFHEAQKIAFAAAGINLNLELNQYHGEHQQFVENRYYDHHLTHAATACYTSPFKEGVCAIIDGFGEGSASAFYRFENGLLTRLDEMPSDSTPPGSLGFFYAQLAYACGFDPLAGEEWKVMGLAPYGKRDSALFDLMRDLLHVDGLTVKPNTDYVDRLAQLFDMRRASDSSPLDAANMAHTGQLVFADISSELLNNLAAAGVSDNLILGGGCALNSSYNGRLLEQTPFQKLHAYAAPADDGNAVGAALLAYYEDNKNESEWQPAFSSPYLGEELSSESLQRYVEFSGMTPSYHGPDVHIEAAKLIADNKIIAWVQGRAEFGPRSLGNRSILADPRTPEVKERLNASVKFREEFRPFAPSILAEYGEEYFEEYQDAPYMERTLMFKEAVKDRVPGAVHFDGTGRLQTVKREWNERYYDLISEFHRLTGVPLVINTSFNIMGKPIVHSVEDCLAVFHTSGIDALVMNDYLFVKK